MSVVCFSFTYLFDCTKKVNFEYQNFTFYKDFCNVQPPRSNFWPISGQCSNFTPPENTRKLLVLWCFKGYKVEKLARNGLNIMQKSVTYNRKKVLQAETRGTKYSRMGRVKFMEDKL